MTAVTQYLTASVSGVASTPANALGAPDAVYTTDTGNTNWAHTWSFDPLSSGTLNTDLTLTLRARQEASGGNAASIDSIVVSQNGTPILTSGAFVPDTAGAPTDIVVVIPRASLLDLSPLSIEVNTTGGGGNPALRRSAQVDGATLTYESTPITGTVLKAWNGSAWVQGITKKYNGATWEQVQLKKHNGSTWELI